MKTTPFILAPLAAVLLLTAPAGCKSPNTTTSSAAPKGPATNAVVLSSKKTFDIVGRTGKELSDSEPQKPAADVTTQTTRSILESRGYTYQPGSPDFVVSIAWNEYTAHEAPTPVTPEAGMPVGASKAVEKASFAIVVRDGTSGQILWQSAGSDPVDPAMVTDDQARALATTALRDFPPAQSQVAMASTASPSP